MFSFGFCMFRLLNYRETYWKEFWQRGQESEVLGFIKVPLYYAKHEYSDLQHWSFERGQQLSCFAIQVHAGGTWKGKAQLIPTSWTKLKRKGIWMTWCECTFAADLKLHLWSSAKICKENSPADLYNVLIWISKMGSVLLYV